MKAHAAIGDRQRPPTTPILGVNISLIDLDSALERIARWIERNEQRYVCVADVHQIMQAYDDDEHSSILNHADMVTPDGAPLAWVGRVRRSGLKSRVTGTALLVAASKQSAKRRWRHYFYGGAEGVAAALSRRLEQEHPGFIVAGYDSPPFRALTEAEHRTAIDRIRAANPDIVWVGLGCPKQEQWMSANVEQIQGAVLIGVGAAFDFQTGRIKRAPVWMQKLGFEWLHRLFSEPRRLWRRYLITAPRFVLLAIKETLNIGKTQRRKNGGAASNP